MLGRVIHVAPLPALWMLELTWTDTLLLFETQQSFAGTCLQTATFYQRHGYATVKPGISLKYYKPTTPGALSF